jgi:hypothetical protein
MKYIKSQGTCVDDTYRFTLINNKGVSFRIFMIVLKYLKVVLT